MITEHLRKAKDTTKKVVIHIGWHKTGSSSLQVALNEAKTLPFLYPRAGRERIWTGAHHDLTLSDHLTEICAALKSEIDSAAEACVLISCEDLSRPVHLTTLIQLCDTLSDHDVELVAVLRRHDQYFESFYAEEVKRGRTVLKCWEYFQRNPGLLDFLDQVRMIEDATGKTCRLLPYKRDMSPAALAQTLTGLDTPLEETFRQNVSLPPLFTEAIRTMRLNRGTAFKEAHIDRSYKFMKAQDPVLLKNLRRFNGFLTYTEREAIFQFKLRENYELGRVFNDTGELWWTLKGSENIATLPEQNPVALLFELLVYRHLSPEWRE